MNRLSQMLHSTIISCASDLLPVLVKGVLEIGEVCRRLASGVAPAIHTPKS